MLARKYRCRVMEKRWLTPTVFALRFAPHRRLRFDPGQFLSVSIPAVSRGERPAKRCYSLVSASDHHGKATLEIWVKRVPGGKGSEYLSRLEPGQEFEARGPFGLFRFHRPEAGRQVVFIATGTGTAPVQAILQSDAFRKTRARALVLVGVRDESEILAPEKLASSGAEVIFALSRSRDNWAGFRGKVTDFLQALPRSWPWHATDFYVVGSGEMVRDVVHLLCAAHGVSRKAIHTEAFSHGRAAATGAKLDLSTRKRSESEGRRAG